MRRHGCVSRSARCCTCQHALRAVCTLRLRPCTGQQHRLQPLLPSHDFHTHSRPAAAAAHLYGVIHVQGCVISLTRGTHTLQDSSSQQAGPAQGGRAHSR
jgi:hypothetical protein